MKFHGMNHRDFYWRNMEKCKRNDAYHRAFIYLMGLAPDTRAHINSLFDFDEDVIKTEGLRGAWQTSGTLRLCRLAFNLWNGFTEPDQGAAYSPEDLFCCEFAPYFVYALYIRYPEYLGSFESEAQDLLGIFSTR